MALFLSARVGSGTAWLGSARAVSRRAELPLCVREKRGNRACAVPQTRAEGRLDEMERWLSLFTSSLYTELVQSPVTSRPIRGAVGSFPALPHCSHCCLVPCRLLVAESTAQL